MGHFFSTFAFEAGSRLTGVWVAAPLPEVDDEMVGLASWVQFGPEQHGALESNFLGSHMPFHFGGFEGVGPDGRAWAVMLQVAPVSAADPVRGDVYWPMIDGLDRGLHYNWQAWLRDERTFTREALTGVYLDSGVDPSEIEDWSFSELMQGLLAECCYVSLEQVVAGRIAQCAFPNDDHDCQHDVFRDVFAMWVSGRLSPPEPGPEVEDYWLDLGFFWPEEDLENLSKKQLRKLALSGDWEPREVKAMKRKALIRLLSTPSSSNSSDAPCAMNVDPG